MSTTTFNGQQVVTIDCTPTWEGILKYYIAVLQDGSIEGKKIATAELIRMAQLADKYNESIKNPSITYEESRTGRTATYTPTDIEKLESENFIFTHCIFSLVNNEVANTNDTMPEYTVEETVNELYDIFNKDRKGYTQEFINEIFRKG